ncbi:MAG: glycosyltransferase [Deltaproteobacteria bacterium]|nr:glycosyltransferase [Deltaproteobacteria bacterium]
MTNAISLSVLIPNFNYARYIGETITSVLSQAPADVEVVVTDNASTDASVEVVQAFRDARLRLSVNPCNIGFSANLERVASLAQGRRMLLLSSDDRMRPGAIEVYQRLEAALGAAADRAVWGSASTIIDGEGRETGQLAADERLWRDASDEAALSLSVGAPVRSMPAGKLLRRSLELLRSPLPFATTCYPRALHDAVGGYAGGRLMNPDKWFLWKVLAVADTVYFVDKALFDYRVHGGGQNAIEARSGALKHLTDQYVATFNLPDNVLEKAGLDREQISRAFVEQDVALRGLVSLAEGRRLTARRAVHFGLAAYPDTVRGNPKMWMLRALLRLGPVGSALARVARARAQARWTERERRSER